MKQITQDMANGETRLVETPRPRCTDGSVVIASSRSVVSAGTEKMLLKFGKAGWIDKARQQPDKVRMVFDKVRPDGLLPTIESVRSKLNQPLQMGYCNAGVVLESGVKGFSEGDRVVSSGPHAEIVRMPSNLCAKIPDDVDDETASFTVLGAIALQGVRLAAPTIGESVAVIGLGLIGLLTVQILRANGCRVIGLDFDSDRCKLAGQFGADVVDLSQGGDPVSQATAFSRHRGIDAVIITASTSSNDPVTQAARMSRKRGRIVLVGVSGLELSRADFYEKELSFQVSCSYGPGRYDPNYEDLGHDYPVGFVRWTEQRNFEAVLDLMKDGTIYVKPMITDRFAFSDALKAYEKLESGNSLAIVLEYPGDSSRDFRQTVRLVSEPESPRKDDSISCAFLGGGNYAGRVLIPAFKKAHAGLHTIVTSGGSNAAHHGNKYGFEYASTEPQTAIGNRDINVVVVATRHNLHCQQVTEALNAGKHVFVEKPLALKLDELQTIESAFSEAHRNGQQFIVGFNRRFSPHAQTARALLDRRPGPMAIVITVNAGEIPPDHWTQQRQIGGGRIIGEGCHFIDLSRYLVGVPITSWLATQFGGNAHVPIRDDKATISLNFEDGSMATIHYLANGSKQFPKERVEVFQDGAILQIENFRKMRGFGWPGFSKQNLLVQDKGADACVAAFLKSIRSGGAPAIPPEEIFEVSRVNVEIGERLEQ